MPAMAYLQSVMVKRFFNICPRQAFKFKYKIAAGYEISRGRSTKAALCKNVNVLINFAVPNNAFLFLNFNAAATLK